MNWDTAVDSITRRIGKGIVVRYYEGLITTARSSTKFWNLEPVAIEALAAFHAAEFSKDIYVASKDFYGRECLLNSECRGIPRTKLESIWTARGKHT